MDCEYYRSYGWIVAQPDPPEVERLAREADISLTAARVLLNRGITAGAEVEKFMNPSLEHLHDPMSLPDMHKASDRIARAVRGGESILVHGDYDIDGVTSTALLVRVLEKLKANVTYKIPHRKLDGYDIKAAAVEQARADQVKLIITCDCGTTATESAVVAKRLGIDLIVTDHHEPSSVLPDAYAVVNPKRRDAVYPFSELAGVGVALKTAQAVASALGVNQSLVLDHYLDLAAIGTVGDVVPLLGENRAIVKHGLTAVSKSNKIGIRTAIQSTGYAGKILDTYFIGFVLGPRLNAVGRMESAATSVRLLLTKDNSEAIDIMKQMEDMNNQRRAVQQEIFEEAVQLVLERDLASRRVLVLSKIGWNSGVIGVVAGKLAERYGLPAIVLCEDPETGNCHGSGRSRPGFHMEHAVQLCRSLLIRCGGHASAVGISLCRENLEEFEAKINEIALTAIPEEEVGPQIAVDAELDVSNVNMDTADLLASMKPFGNGNPEPVFVASGLQISHAQTMGADRNHLKLFFEGIDARPVECVAFGWGQHSNLFGAGAVVDICYSLQVNEYNGNRTVQMLALDIRRTA